MTVGELRHFLAPFTDEARVVCLDHFGEIVEYDDPRYHMVNGEGFVVLPAPQFGSEPE